MKKFLSLFLAALMVMSCFGSLAATAAGYVTSTFAVECTEAGADGLEEDQFRVDLVVYNNPGISGYQFSLAFDNELIQVVDVVREYDEEADEDVIATAFPVAPTLNIEDPSVDLSELDRITAVASRAESSNKNGVYLSFVFQVVGDFKETDLAIEDALFVTDDMRKVTFDLVDGTFTNSTKLVQNVSVTAPSSLVIGAVGGRVDVTVNVGNNVAPTFVSSNEKVLTVDSNGNITPVGKGTATITVKIAGDSTYSAFTKVISITVVGNLEGQIGSGTVSAGNTVSIPVIVNQNPGISGYQLEFTYDSTKIDVVGVANGDILSATPTYVTQGNKVVVSASQSASSAATGTLLVLTFAVNESTPNGTYGIKLDSDNSSVVNQEQVGVALSDGAVTVVDYTITYNANGGTGAPATAIKKFAATYTVSAAVPTRFGYDFNGWIGSDGKTYQAGDTYTSNADLTLTAIWAAKNVTIYFDANGGTASATEATVLFGSAVGSLIVPVRVGYTFVGWFTAKEGGEEVKAATVVDFVEAKTLYAHWTANSYKVTFDARGGKTSVSEMYVTYDGVFGDLPDATKSGYTFNGWYLDEDCSVRVNEDTIVKIKSDITLYASYSVIPGAVMYGDANNDGAINAKDAVILAQHLAKWETSINLAAADCNGDGAINSKDAVLLAQYLAKWDVVLGGAAGGNGGNGGSIGDVEIPGDDLVSE